MRRLSLYAIVFVSATALAAPAPADDSPTDSLPASDSRAGGADTSDDQAIGELIQQLGDSSFAVRQRASKQLVELGIVGQPRLSAALSDEDAEVRSRAAQVLAQVIEADFHARLEAFANDPLGKREHALPSWNYFRETFGDDKAARALFVEMQRAEPGLLEALESGPKVAGELLPLRIQAVLQSIQWPQFNGGVPPAIPLGTISTMLLVSSVDGVRLGEQDASQLYNLIQQTSFQSNLRATGNSALLKKLLGMWILHNDGPTIAYMNLQLAFNYDLKEGLDLALKMIGHNDGQQPSMRQYVILAIGRFGNHEHIPLIEPLLKDTTACMPGQQNNDPRQSQIRDVALAVLIKLSGQELKDYGLEQVQQNSQMLFQPGTIMFRDPAKREAALKKWREWSQQRPEFSGGDAKNSDAKSARTSGADPKK